MSNYINNPSNVEIFDEDYVLRIALKKYHFSNGYILPNIFLLREKKNENSLSVVVEKTLDSSEDVVLSALRAVPPPPSNYSIERVVLKIKAGDLRKLLIGVSHSPSNNNPSHGSLHGYFNINKAHKIKKIAVELKEEIFNNVNF